MVWSIQDQRVKMRSKHYERLSSAREIAMSASGDRVALSDVYASDCTWEAELRVAFVCNGFETFHRKIWQPCDMTRHSMINREFWRPEKDGKAMLSVTFGKLPYFNSEPLFVCQRYGASYETITIVPRDYARAWDVFGDTVVFGRAHGEITFMHFREGVVRRQEEWEDAKDEDED